MVLLLISALGDDLFRYCTIPLLLAFANKVPEREGERGAYKA